MLFLFVCFCQMLKKKNSKSVVYLAAWWFAKWRQSTSRNDVVMRGGRNPTAPQIPPRPYCLCKNGKWEKSERIRIGKRKTDRRFPRVL